MNRRDAIERVAMLMGGAVIGSEFFLSGCKPNSSGDAEDLFNEKTTAFMDEIGETILPKTSTPGAKATHIGKFMAIMVRDCYNAEDQKIFKDGLKKLDDASKKKSGKIFMEASSSERTELLIQLDKEQKAYSKTKKEKEPNHYFTMLKQLTLLGYFTSEIGCTQALRYVPVPGKYLGDYPYKKGDKAWALA